MLESLDLSSDFGTKVWISLFIFWCVVTFVSASFSPRRLINFDGMHGLASKLLVFAAGVAALASLLDSIVILIFTNITSLGVVTYFWASYQKFGGFPSMWKMASGKVSRCEVLASTYLSAKVITAEGVYRVVKLEVTEDQEKAFYLGRRKRLISFTALLLLAVGISYWLFPVSGIAAFSILLILCELTNAFVPLRFFEPMLPHIVEQCECEGIDVLAQYPEIRRPEPSLSE